MTKTVETETPGMYAIWCEGCQCKHFIWTKSETGPKWGFNGDVNEPTFTPSVNITWPEIKDGVTVNHRCHFTITNGAVHFHGDSTHQLAGKRLPLLEIKP
jgi:hypothetical protein